MKIKQQKQLNSRQRLHLIEEVFDAAEQVYESFQTSEIGADLAYLFAAIASNSFCEWPADRPLLKNVLKSLGRKHPVWRYIRIAEEN